MIRATGILGGVLFLSLTVANANASTSADDTNCLDQTLTSQIQAKFTIETADLMQYDRCKPDTHTWKTLQALEIVKSIQFAENASAKPFNQQILPHDFWTYFSQRVNTLQEDSRCDPGILAYVFGVMNDGVVHLCPELFDEQISKYERAATMLHEARHFEGFQHVDCTRGPRKGQKTSCDDSIEEFGSYAVTVETLTKMALESKNIPTEQKTMVKILALTYANEAFNTPVRSRDLSAFYLVGSDHQGYIYSDKGLVPVAPLEGDKIVSRGAALAVFPKDKGDAFTINVFAPNLDHSPPMGSFSASYNALPKDQRPSVVDILNLDYLSVSATTTQLAGQLSNAMTDTIVPLETPAKAAYSGIEVGFPDQDSMYVVTIKDEMERVQFLPGDQYKITPVANPLTGLQAVMIFNDQRFALTDAGQVVVENTSNGKWSAFPALAKIQFSQMTRPFLWDQYFEDGVDGALAF